MRLFALSCSAKKRSLTCGASCACSVLQVVAENLLSGTPQLVGMGSAGCEVGSPGGSVEKCVSPQAEKHGEFSSHLISHRFFSF